MQNCNGTIKKFGHNRKPSFGKSLPISTLLLNYNQSSKPKFDSISRDGLSPEYDRPPLLFCINDVDDSSVHIDVIDNVQRFRNKQNTNCIDAQLNNNNNNNNRKMCASLPIIEIEELPCFNCTKNNTNDEKLLCLSTRAAAAAAASSTSSSSSNCLPAENACETIKKLCNNNNCTKNTTSTTMETINCNTKNNRQQFLSTMLQNNETKTTETIRKCMPDLLLLENIEKINDNNKIGCQNNNNNNNNNNDNNKLSISAALLKTSMMTSPAAKRRLMARKFEFELNSKLEFNDNYYNCCDDDNGDACKSSDNDNIPPKQLLMYLVRMGSFNSAPKINNCDTQDDTTEIPKGLSTIDLIHHCKLMRGDDRPPLLTRYFLKSNTVPSDITSGLRILQLNSVSKVCSPPNSSPNHIRVLQWNILSQSLGQNYDGFICCPDEALTWECRKYLIVQEIIQNDPDIVCLQEVDHYKFLLYILSTQNYDGIFFPKPDSPCLYMNENNGPDGCAIFFKKNKFELLNFDTRILKVWKVQSNQVAIAANFKVIGSNKEFSVCTTHLKARKGPLLAKLRNEQGKDLLKFAHQISENRPIIMCGDFNAEPTEPIYSTILNFNEMSLSSAYADMFGVVNGVPSTVVPPSPLPAPTPTPNDFNETKELVDKFDLDEQQYENQNNENRVQRLASQEPPFTTWKIREDGEICHTIDYVFYSEDKFKVSNCLLFPNDSEIGHERTPSFQYPSDHFSLVCDFELLDD